MEIIIRRDIILSLHGVDHKLYYKYIITHNVVIILYELIIYFLIIYNDFVTYLKSAVKHILLTFFIIIHFIIFIHTYIHTYIYIHTHTRM